MGDTDTSKVGKRLSAKQLERLADARRTIDELVKWANYEDDEPPAAEPAEGKALLTVKALGNGRIGGYAVLWGDQSKPDLTGEWFDAQTQELDAILKATGKLPVLYQHALDGQLQTTVVGLADTLRTDRVGLWYEAQLTLAGEYRSALDGLISKRALGTSSGTLPGARKVAKGGHIERWPIVELSLTPTPAEPRMMARPVAEIKAAFAAAGLDYTPLDSDGPRGTADALPRAVDTTEIPAAGVADTHAATPSVDIDLELERVRVLALEGR